MTCHIDLFIKVMAPVMLHCLDRQKCEVNLLVTYLSLGGAKIYTNYWKQWSCDVIDHAVANKHQNQCKIPSFGMPHGAKTLRPWTRLLAKPCVRTQFFSSRDAGSCVREIPEDSIWYFWQNLNSLLVKRQNDNTSPVTRQFLLCLKFHIVH